MKRCVTDSGDRVTFLHKPTVNATYVIPSVRPGSQSLSSGAWNVPIQIGGQEIHDTIDTVADITIISGKVYESLRPKPTIVRDTNVRLADEGAGMTAQYIGDLNIRIGAYDFVHPVYVGPLQDEMLLGKDFLRAQGAEVSCEAGNLKVRRIAKLFELSTGVPMSVINAVSARRVRIPSHTAHIIEREMPDFILAGARHYISAWYSGLKNIQFCRNPCKVVCVEHDGP